MVQPSANIITPRQGRAASLRALKGHRVVAGDAIPGDGAGASSPQILYIVFDPAPLKKLHILLLKRLLPMVCFLAQDISLNRGDS